MLRLAVLFALESKLEVASMFRNVVPDQGAPSFAICIAVPEVNPAPAGCDVVVDETFPS